MVLVAGEFGNGAVRLMEFARSAESLEAVRRVFADLRTSISEVTPALAPLLAGFRDIGVVGSGFLTGLAPGIGEAAAQFGRFLTLAAESGRALVWMETALEVFRALGSIAADVGGIVRGVFSAVSAAGGSALGVVGNLVDAFNAWVNSAEGQAVLVEVFRALEQIGRALWPVLESLAGAVAHIAPQVGDLAAALGPALSAAISALGPAVAALGPGLVSVADALARAFASPQVSQGLLTLGTGLSNLLIALSPLIPPLVELAGILVERLGTNLTLLATLLQPVVSALADVLAPILPQLAELFRQVAEAVLPFAEQLGGQLASALRDTQSFLQPVTDALREVGGEVLAALQQVLPQVTPHIGDLARAFASVAAELVKLLPDLIRFGGEILVELINQAPVLAPMLADLAEQLLAIFQAATPLIPPMLQLLLEIVKPLIPEVPKLLPPFIDLVRIFADLFAKASPLIAKLLESPEALAAVKMLANNGVFALKTLQRAFELVLGAVQTFIGVVIGSPDMVNQGLSRIGDAIRKWINDIIGWVEGAMNSFAGLVPGLPVVRLPRLAQGAIIRRPTLALVGEAGDEVVLPLTRPARALQLARQSGLLDVLAGAERQAAFGRVRASLAGSLSAGSGYAAGVTVVREAGQTHLHLHFSGQPLVSREEIARLVIDGVAEAARRGFPLGPIGSVTV
ncbi:hypothetical protein GCM10023259_080420 [Thermocatellispora tengchongensis]